jgi:hypothetical protein
LGFGPSSACRQESGDAFEAAEKGQQAGKTRWTRVEVRRMETRGNRFGFRFPGGLKRIREAMAKLNISFSNLSS